MGSDPNSQGDLLIGRIALREGLITKEQLYDCLISQERNPAKNLGALLVSRGYLKNEDIPRLLELQKRAMGDHPARQGALLGQILVRNGLATEYQVNEGLRLQGRLADLGIQPVPQIGQILIKRGYLRKEALETALQLQNLTLYTCPECGAPIDTGSGAAGSNPVCPKCGSEIPFLFAQMASAVHEALEEASRLHEKELPAEVRIAAQKASNHFGRHILVREIGRGGAGIVYRAWQKDRNRVVALKLLPHDSDTAAGIRTPYGDAEDVKRFYTEVKAVAELDHPNIVPVWDFGSVEQHFYYTMKFVEGATLDMLLHDPVDRRIYVPPAWGGEPMPDRGMPLKASASAMRDVCRALQYAHERGVFHRDIKPSNIILEAGGKPYVMDFGLAKVQRIGDSAYVKGVIMGTPYYMPPEQASGDMERVDNLSDVYSLGAVLYELVSGTPPYGGRSTDEVLAKLPTEPPEPLEMIAPWVPESLRRIVAHAMQRSKGDRYPSAAAMADDLQRFLDDVPLPLEPVEPRSGSIWGIFKQILGQGS